MKKDPATIKYAAALKRLGRAKDKLATAQNADSKANWRKIVEILQGQIAKRG